ncbi:MAG: Bacterial transcription activator, effector binding domain [Methanomassiliicoccales archaeon PtaU1.Bin124]|nr:MAG: Bacterial transcription activator, effector binding domain [Methanomassiliicoccales archaeon PtaU1.Bin124]
MTEFQLVTTERQMTVSIQAKVNVQDISSYMGKAYGELFAFSQKNGLTIVGPPIAYYNSWNDQEVDVICAFPVSAPFHPEGMFKAFELPKVKAVVAIHVGPYKDLVVTYTAMQKWMEENGLVPEGYMWEEYLNDPSEVGQEDARTKLTWPVK